MTEPRYMFRACSYEPSKIARVKVIKLTPKTLTYEHPEYFGKTSTSTVLLKSSCHATFLTWEEARDWLLQYAETQLGVARRRLQVAQSTVGNIKGMKKPEYEDE
jgi:hypothetical protein